MVHQMVDVAGLELVEQRHGNRTVGHSAEEGDGPVDLVSRADGHLVAALKSAIFKKDVKFGNPFGQIPVKNGRALIV